MLSPALQKMPVLLRFEKGSGFAKQKVFGTGLEGKYVRSK
jgi:hypothetical protein